MLASTVHACTRSMPSCVCETAWSAPVPSQSSASVPWTSVHKPWYVSTVWNPIAVEWNLTLSCRSCMKSAWYSFFKVFRLHCNTTLMRPIVTDGVAWSVCRSVRQCIASLSLCTLYVCLSVSLCVTITSHAKTAEPIEMPFGGWTQFWPKELCFRWGFRFPMWKGHLEGKRGSP